MGKRTWLNLGLLLLVLLLAALIYWQPDNQAPQALLLTSLEPHLVQQVRIERPDAEAIVLQRNGEQWRLLEPVEVSANQVAVQLILGLLSGQSLQRYPAQGLELQKYGLQQPRAVLLADGVQLSFGRVNPLNSRLYVMVDDVMHMVGQNDISFLTQAWYRYISPGLFAADSELRRLVIPGLGRLERSADGWRFDGAMAPDSNDQMQALVDAWQHAQAMQVRPMEVAVATETAVVELVSGEEISFGVLATAQDLVLQRPEFGIEYLMDASRSRQMLQWQAPGGEAGHNPQPDAPLEGE